MTYYLHLTLSPVQDFVAQARRTRDFWAGSFLLSWLSAVAIREVGAQKGEVVFPLPSKSFIKALSQGTSNENPKQGNVPNRFKADLKTDDVKIAIQRAKAIAGSIQIAWEQLAKEVFVHDLADHPESEHILELWNTQINGFWDVAWVLTQDNSDTKCLDRRKYWRSYLPPEQGGIKCMMMDGWQELSGLPKKGEKYPTRSMLDNFWKPIQQKKYMETDIREGELLCAIAFVKRRFVRHFEDFSYAMPSGWILNGWDISPNVPSVSYMAGVHWLKNILKKQSDPDLQPYIDRYLEAARALGGLPGKQMNMNIQCFPESRKSDIAIDGNVFHLSALENINIFPNRARASKVISTLSELTKKSGLPKASPFYAVLLMDGDSIGKLLQSFKGDHGIGEKKLSEALLQFTQQVEKTVAANNGFLIYAGGDDVLALLPIEDAITCAAQLHQDYATAFDKVGLSGTSTLSGAIQFSHIKVPLNKLLSDAHDLLDNVAKAKTGRNALAVRVQRSSGSSLEWSMPWDNVMLDLPIELVVNDDRITVVSVIEKLAYQLKALEEQEARFSNRLLFKIEEFFAQLGLENERSNNIGFEEDDIRDLLFMAYRNSGKSRSLTDTIEADDLLPLLEQSYRYETNLEGKVVQVGSMPTINAALLMRFLAQKGVE